MRHGLDFIGASHQTERNRLCSLNRKENRTIQVSSAETQIDFLRLHLFNAAWPCRHSISAVSDGIREMRCQHSAVPVVTGGPMEPNGGIQSEIELTEVTLQLGWLNLDLILTYVLETDCVDQRC